MSERRDDEQQPVTPEESPQAVDPPDPAAAPADSTWRRQWAGWGSPGRWSGRRTVVALVAALTVGVLGAVGATAAIAQSDEGGRGGVGRGGHGQFPGGGQGQLPGGGQGRAPGGGQGQAPDRDGDRGFDGPAPGAPGGGTDSTDPGDANGNPAAPTT